jgi:hypothetical protein
MIKIIDMSCFEDHYEDDISGDLEFFTPDLQDDLCVKENCAPGVCFVPDFEESEVLDGDGNPILGLKALFSDGVIRPIDCIENSCYEEVCNVGGDCDPCPVYDCVEVLKALSEGMVPYDPCCPLKNIEKIYVKECCFPLEKHIPGDYAIDVAEPNELSRVVVGENKVEIKPASIAPKENKILVPAAIATKPVTEKTKTFHVDLSSNKTVLVNDKRAPNIHLYVGKKYTFTISKENPGHALFFSLDENGFFPLKELQKLERGELSFFATEKTPKTFYYMDYKLKNKIGTIFVH